MYAFNRIRVLPEEQFVAKNLTLSMIKSFPLPRNVSKSNMARGIFIRTLDERTRGPTGPELSNRKQGGIGESQLLPISRAMSSTNDNPIATMPLARIAR